MIYRMLETKTKRDTKRRRKKERKQKRKTKDKERGKWELFLVRRRYVQLGVTYPFIDRSGKVVVLR